MLAVSLLGTVVTMKIATFACCKSLMLLKSIGNLFVKTPEVDALQQLLFKTDIKKKIARTHKLICELALLTELQESVLMAIRDLGEVIEHLNVLFEELLNLESHHKQLYFHQWRTIDQKGNVDDISTYIDLFNLRFDDMLKMIQITDAVRTR